MSKHANLLDTPEAISRFVGNAKASLDTLWEAAPAAPAAAAPVSTASRGWGPKPGASPAEALAEITPEIAAKMKEAGHKIVEYVAERHPDLLKLFPEKTLLEHVRGYVQAHGNIATIEGVDSALAQMNPRSFLSGAVKSLKDSLPHVKGHAIESRHGRAFMTDMSRDEFIYRNAVESASRRLGQLPTATSTASSAWSEMSKIEKIGTGAGGALASLLFLIGFKQVWDSAHATDPLTGEQKTSWNQAMLGALNLAFGGMIAAGVAAQLKGGMRV